MRNADWEQRLADYLAQASDRPFAWGQHDCVLFAAGAVAAMTGIDPAARWRGKYRSANGAARVLRRAGARSVEEAVDALFPERPIAFARRGDVVLASESLGICIGGDALFFSETIDPESGVVISAAMERLPRRDWQKAWAVD